MQAELEVRAIYCRGARLPGLVIQCPMGYLVLEAERDQAILQAPIFQPATFPGRKPFTCVPIY